MMVENKKEKIKERSGTILIFFGIVGFIIICKVLYLQTVKRKLLLSKVTEIQRKERVINATRGNIYASDGKSLLATSVPKYHAIFDPSQAKQKLFKENIDSLTYLLARFFGDQSPQEYKEKITSARKAKIKYLLLGDRKIDHSEKLLLEKFPLFREGANKGGGRFESEEFRFLPFNNLAMRTIGKLDKKKNKYGDFGIEASFENYLKGKDGTGLYERMAGGIYKPINSETDIDSEPGLDVVTTIDVNFQDIVENALRNRVYQTQAKYGTAVVMEIATGEIKAIANLTRKINDNNELQFIEDQNYAIKGGTDPGSTFKLASLAAILEKTNMKLNDFAVNCPGEIKHRNLSFTCSHKHGVLTVQQVFEQSCNIGVYELMKKTFGFSQADEYFEYLAKFRLDKPSGFQLKGEPLPLLKNNHSTSFSSTTVPWMSIGYESRITPIQMLTFYNAMANNGYWVQPIIVKEIRKGIDVFEAFEANKITKPICSEKTIEKVHKMMEGVVLNGTAKNVKDGVCSIAGKTGTSQKRVNGHYKQGLYYTSFIGYFPANSPKYSCIVVIDEPIGTNIYAADVSAPVFRNIADKIFAYDVSMHKSVNEKSKTSNISNAMAFGLAHDIEVISKKFSLPYDYAHDGFLKPGKIKRDTVYWKQKNPYKNFDDLIGLSFREALPLLENRGYRVKYSGSGKVKSYSLVGKNIVAITLN